MLIDALLYGVYMGITAFIIPLILPLYSFYTGLDKPKGIGRYIFFGRFISYILVFILLLCGLGTFLETNIVGFFLNILSSVVSLLFIAKLIKDLGKTSGNQVMEYEDINRINHIDRTIKLKRKSKSILFYSFCLNITSIQFLYWCDFSILSTVIKLNYKDENMGLIYICVFLFSMFLALLILDSFFSILTKTLGKYINKLIRVPFIITVIILFGSYSGYSIYDAFVNFKFF